MTQPHVGGRGELHPYGTAFPVKPPSGWSASGKLVTRNVFQTVALQVEFPKGGPHTLQFSLQVPQDVLAVCSPRAIANISWSVAGNTVNRRINVINGATISGVSEGVLVVIEDATDTLVAAGLEYKVAVSVAPGLRANYISPPILYPFNASPNCDKIIVVPGGGAGSIVPIPQNVGIVSVHIAVGRVGVPGAGTPIPDQMVQAQLDGFNLNKVYDPRQCCWEPVSASATNLTLINWDILAHEIGFSVEFGIDG